MLEIKKAAVIGAGTMGLGIAGQLANADVDVLLLDLPAESGPRNALAERAMTRLLDKRQPGLLHADKRTLITLGNIEDDLQRLHDVDWIAEAVVERLDVKRKLYRDIDAVRKPGSIVSSNTSTIPISLLTDGMPDSFCSEFAITHYFNPVRYMRLLELVRGEKTRSDVIDCLLQFNKRHMGKGVVLCEDTPGFLANRVGVFAIQTALHEAFRMGLTAEEADAIFGRPMGIPKTGVFGLYDLIGIDLMSDVARSLASILPAEDAFHEVAGEIPLLTALIEAGRIGNKGGTGGFYRQTPDGQKETLDFATSRYRPHNAVRPSVAAAAERQNSVASLISGNDRYSRYAWKVLSDTLCYAAQLVPDVNESLLAVDDAMKLGYNWQRGPFELIDDIGATVFAGRLTDEDRPIPAMLAVADGRSFYRVDDGELQYLLADGGYRRVSRPAGIRRFSEERRTLSPVLANEVSSYYVLPEKVGLIEFHSKGNTLNDASMQLIAEAVEHASRHCEALVLHSDAAHFSCGVNLGDVLAAINDENWPGTDRFLHRFQNSVLALKHAPLPVVAAPSGMSLGGGFEVLLHADKVIYHANSVSGLVESLVGLVPGGGGVKEMLYRCVALEEDGEKGAWRAFKTIAAAHTAQSPLEALDLGLFRPGIDEFEMNRDCLLTSAVNAAKTLAKNYEPERRKPMKVSGHGLWNDMKSWLDDAHAGGNITAHDVTTGNEIAMIVCGGDVPRDTLLTEQDFLDLERKAFVALARTPQTRARIEHLLTIGRPLRN